MLIRPDKHSEFKPYGDRYHTSLVLLGWMKAVPTFNASTPPSMIKAYLKNRVVPSKGESQAQVDKYIRETAEAYCDSMRAERMRADNAN